MATIEKRGETYRITVSIGYDVNGKQIRKRMTYKPPENLTPSQLKKDLQKKALDFEEKCQSGLYLDGRSSLPIIFQCSTRITAKITSANRP